MALQLEADPLIPGSFGPGKRQPLYEAGSIGSVTYRIDELPAEEALREHLRSMLLLLDDAASTLRRVHGPKWTGVSRAAVDELVATQPRPGFRPKSSQSYSVELPTSMQARTRLREQIVNDLAAQESAGGWQATSEPPMDLVLRRRSGDREIIHIVDVKQVHQSNAMEAVRAAIGQLITYRWEHFPEGHRSTVGLVAAFSEDVGLNLSQLLSKELGIAILWLDERRWRGCARAHRDGLVPTA